jgi:hypothetical protein
MVELSQAAGHAAAYFAQRIGVGKLAKQHGDELVPTGETLGVPLAHVPFHNPGKRPARDFVDDLTEETR